MAHKTYRTLADISIGPRGVEALSPSVSLWRAWAQTMGKQFQAEIKFYCQPLGERSYQR